MEIIIFPTSMPVCKIKSNLAAFHFISQVIENLFSSPKKNFSVLFKQDTLSSELTEFLNPNNFSSDGTVALNMYATLFSNDGSLLAYGLTESGSDWITIKVRDVETGNDYPDTIKNVRFYPMSWTIDNKGFFYGVS